MREPADHAPLRIFYSQVHGMLHENKDGSRRQDIISRCRVGEELDLIPEPDNPFDSSAVKICRKNGEQIGYWQADGRMAHDLSIGWTYRVTIDEIYGFQRNDRKRPSEGVRLRVEVLTMSRRTEERRAKREPPHVEVPQPQEQKPKRSWWARLFG